MTAILAAVAAVVTLTVVATIAYHRGRRQGLVTLPPALIAELRDHKIRCIGEPPQSVALEIRLLCGETSRS